MQDILETVAQLSRPKLLVRSAKSAAQHYKRDRDLPRLLPGQRPHKHAATILKLMELEQGFDDRRRAHEAHQLDGAGYLAADHLDVLIALVGEVQLLRAAHQEF